MNRNYPRVIAYAGPEYFRLDLTDFAASQGVAQLKMYVGHCCRRDRTGELLLIKKDYIELLVGRGKCLLKHPLGVMVEYIEQTWIVALANF